MLLELIAGVAITGAARAGDNTNIKAVEFEPKIFQSLPGRQRCQGVGGYRLSFGGRRTFLWRPEWLALEKRRVVSDPAYAKPLIEAAEAALKRGSYSVVDKTKLPASGDRHDYYSIGPYWWPTKGKPNGEPYTRRDGEVNPESRGNEFDRDRISKLSDDVRVLALAYHHLGDKRYADHAAKLVRAWFVSPETRMNPNLNHGQAVPGINSGRGEGIIELNALGPVIESIGLIEQAKAFTDTELASLEKWFADMARWMASSPVGQEERSKQNNHGIYYDYLITHFALFARLEPTAKQVVWDFPGRRIAKQFKKDGSLPEELARTRSWHYSFYALEAATKLATVGECVGLSLWSFRTADQRGLAQAFVYLAPYQANTPKWPHKDKELADPLKQNSVKRAAIVPLRMMAWGTSDIGYEYLAAHHGVTLDATRDYWLPPFDNGKATKGIR